MESDTPITGANRRQTDEWFYLLVDTMSEGVFILDREARIVFVNDRICQMLGFLREELLGCPWDSICEVPFEDFILEHMSGTTIFPPIEMEWMTRHGKIITPQVTIKTLFNKAGEFIGLAGFARELVETRIVEHGLRESEKKYRVLVENSFTGIYIEQHEKIVYANHRLAEILGYRPHELLGRKVAALIQPQIASLFAAGFQTPLSEDPNPSVAFSFVRSDGQTIWVKQKRSPIDYLGRTAYLNTLFDITEEKMLQQSLRESQSAMQVLSKRLMSVQEQERKRVASELHDSLGQYLCLLERGLKELDSLTRESMSTSGKSLLQKNIRIVKYVSTETRRISMDLSPKILDDLGLIATISWYSRQFREAFSSIVLEVSIQVEEDEIPRFLRIVMFRILQEAMTNITKHAKAGKVMLKLKNCEDGGICLSIADNGRGIVLRKSSPREFVRTHFGLASMRERSELSGGRFEIHTEKGKGTEIQVIWPRAALLD
jgi:PAS domain S-box-containing protein